MWPWTSPWCWWKNEPARKVRGSKRLNAVSGFPVDPSRLTHERERDWVLDRVIQKGAPWAGFQPPGQRAAMMDIGRASHPG